MRAGKIFITDLQALGLLDKVRPRARAPLRTPALR
jgi:hypothetical protein